MAPPVQAGSSPPPARAPFGARSGVTFVEVVLACGIMLLLALALFEGIGVSSRLAHENAEFLAADAYAWDVAWQTFNQDYKELQRRAPPPPGEVASTYEHTMARAEAPALYYDGSPAVRRTTYSLHHEDDFHPGATNVTHAIDGVTISVNVEWGPAGSRKRLDGANGSANARSFNHVVSILRSKLAREQP